MTPTTDFKADLAPLHALPLIELYINEGLFKFGTVFGALDSKFSCRPSLS